MTQAAPVLASSTLNVTQKVRALAQLYAGTNFMELTAPGEA